MSMSRESEILIASFMCDFEKINALSMVVMIIIKYEKIQKFIYSRNHDLNDLPIHHVNSQIQDDSK
jgi:hypothetical protein